MNKKELKEALVELKIDFDSRATNAELEELLKEAKKFREEAVKTGEVEPVEEKVEEKEEKKVEITKAHIYLSPRGISDGEQLVRTYTEIQSDEKGVKNGLDFIEKAEGYAKKIGGHVRTE